MRLMRVLLGILLPAPISALLFSLVLIPFEVRPEWYSNFGMSVLLFTVGGYFFIGFQSLISSLVLEFEGVELLLKYQSKMRYLFLAFVLGILSSAPLLIADFSAWTLLLGGVVGIITGYILSLTVRGYTPHNQ